MSLPVSQYEALLAEVRGLRKRAQHVQQLVNPFISNSNNHTGATQMSYIDSRRNILKSVPHQSTTNGVDAIDRKMDNDFDLASSSKDCEGERGARYVGGDDDDCCAASHCTSSNSSTQLSVNSEPTSVLHHHHHHSTTSNNKTVNNLYHHGTWPAEKATMWCSEPNNLDPSNLVQNNRAEVTSVMSFASSSGGVPLDRVLGSNSSKASKRTSQEQFEAKVDMVHSLLSMLANQEHADMGETLLALSTSPESCMAMRQSGCILLLVQLVQSDSDAETRKKAAQALNNLVYSQPDEKIRKREIRLLKLLDHLRSYVDSLKNDTEFVAEGSTPEENGDKHPVQTIAHLMKLSFDEGHRHAICQLGGIYIIANLVEVEHLLHGSINNEPNCILLRRYACMALTNLTFGDSGNKTLLCSFKNFMRALVVQLENECDELRQVTGSVLRNLSWRADQTSKEILREVGTVTGLMRASMMHGCKENTLKSIMSALWNLSAHCRENKLEICSVDGALAFLVELLTYETPSKSLAVIENAGGILRNVSSQIAIRDDYREILRQHNCLQILLDQLKSPSLTIVSNACGTLWNLSAKNAIDQETLWSLGAPAMLRSLNHSKHKMIAIGSSAALKNLLGFKQPHPLLMPLDSTAKAMDLPVLPTLDARKQKALLQGLDQNLTETYENIDSLSPTRKNQEYLPQYEYELNRAFSMLDVDGTTKTSATAPITSNELKVPNQPFAVVKPTFRNKYANYDEEETDLAEQPIDYSVKYTEEDEEKRRRVGKSTTEPDANYGIYAETDLDQPTDYSLRYAENNDEDSDSESDAIRNKILLDTVKTYCTEGTPYETPFNFSNATSLTDLRLKSDDARRRVIDNDKIIERAANGDIGNDKGERVKLENMSDEKERCSIEDISETETGNNVVDNGDKKLLKSQFSSGLMSPEKPVNYCEEGTPGYFSRVSSFGSLNSIPAIEATTATTTTKDNNDEGKIVEKTQETATAPVKTVESAQSIDVKAVKFDEAVNYAEETPLMFSRSSSLASLDSVEQHSIHDDRSSVVSDFSRLTSGIVSPSELPDSPTQTVPPSPKPRNRSMDGSTTNKAIPPVHPRTCGDGRPQPAPRIVATKSVGGSVFKDNVTKFKEESTPIQFSTATSLSSLTIDDREDVVVEDARQNGASILERSSPMASGASGTTVEENLTDRLQGERKKESSGSQLSDEDDENMLADCINIGIQNNRHRQSTSALSTTNKPQHSASTPISSQKTGIPVHSGLQKPLPFTLKYSSPKTAKIDIQADTTHTYCTEDTPAILSHAGSNSDLSMLSMPNESTSKRKEFDLSDDSSNLSGENENILAECIKSAMPKPRRTGDKTKPLASHTLHTQFVDGSNECKTTPSCITDRLRKDATPSNRIPSSCDGAGPSSLPINLTDHRPSDDGRNSPRESLSSLSVESLETEQELLELCISSGMPKSAPPPPPPSQYHHHQQQQSRDPIPVDSKNVNATSVARYTIISTSQDRQESMCPKAVTRTTVTGVDYAKRGTEDDVDAVATAGNDRHRRSHRQETVTANGASSVRNGAPSTTDTTSIEPTKNGFKQDTITTDCEEELEKKPKDDLVLKANRMLDPNAMIESLDRFTAKLVNAHNDSCNSTFCTSVDEDGDNDTWADIKDDFTFPNMTDSIPNDGTFSSENKDETNDVVDGKHDGLTNGISTGLSLSTLIALEANKVAERVQREAERVQSTTSFELDVAPPVGMLYSATEAPKGQRKKLPAHYLIKMALSNSLQHTSSTESLENQMSISNLDQIMPPSLMAEVLNMDDSLNSVASLTNDATANTAAYDAFKNLLNGSFSTHVNLADTMPPSLLNCLLNESTRTDESNEDCRTQAANDQLKTELDEMTECYETRNEAPVQSNAPKRLTPKEKRDLAVDRYKTFTIKPETLKQEIAADDDKTLEINNGGVSDLSNDSVEAKMSPKQKRIANRSRYETQILDETVVLNLSSNSKVAGATGNNNDSNESSLGSSPLDSNSPMSSPARTKREIRKNFLQKRLENKDRFRTQTLSESSLSPDVSSACNSPPLMSNSPPPPPLSNLSYTPDIHYLVQMEANVVLKTLRETRTKPDDLLDCETISLVSIDDDSDHNSGCSMPNNRTYLKNLGFSGTKNNSAPIVDDAAPNQCLEQQQERREEEFSQEEEQRLFLDIQRLNEDGDQTRQKPKIVKPDERRDDEEAVNETNEEVTSAPQEKTVRGRRKPLYSKVGMPSSSKLALSAFNSTAKNVVARSNQNPENKASSSKPPPLALPQQQQQKRTLRAPTATRSATATTSNKLTSTNGKTKTSQRPSPSNSSKSTPSNSTKSSPKRQQAQQTVNKTSESHVYRPLERQGTFTKEDTKTTSTLTVSGTATTTATITAQRSKIPTSTTLIPKPRSASAPRVPVPRANGIPVPQQSAAFTSRLHVAPKTAVRYNRSASTSSEGNSKRNDGTNANLTRRIHPPSQQYSKSSTCINLQTNVGQQQQKQIAKKHVTSKIATLLKKVEETKRQQQQKPDNRVWIQPDIVRDTQQSRLINIMHDPEREESEGDSF